MIDAYIAAAAHAGQRLEHTVTVGEKRVHAYRRDNALDLVHALARLVEQDERGTAARLNDEAA